MRVRFFSLILILILAVMAQLAMSQESSPTAGQVRVNPKDGLRYVWIPPGTFLMGCSPGDDDCSDDEKPAHPVTITKGFWIGQTPVTVGAYERFAGASGRRMPKAPDYNKNWADANMPIVIVTWDDARAYCAWGGGRLPTEAEWEYAARGGTKEARYGDLWDIAWYIGNSGGQAHDVAQKRPNAFGLYDTLGNVWEFVNDWYDSKYYQSSPSQDPPGPVSGEDFMEGRRNTGPRYVVRAGSWTDVTRTVRVSSRFGGLPTGSSDYAGFRCGGVE